MFIKQKKFSGFSILEMILAIGIFVIMLAGSASITNLSGVAGHMALEHDKAVAYLTESIEAVRNIKRVDWENITNGVYGLDSSDGTFKFDGSSDSFEKYTRTITVEDAYRDGDGNISDSGDFDEDIKKITVNVSWDINPYKTKNVEKTFYLADWSLPIINGGNSGMLVYADYSAEDDKLKYRILSSNGKWSAERDVPNLDVPEDRNTHVVELYSSFARDEKILISKHSESGYYLYAQVWDGSNWGNEIELANHGSSMAVDARNFDGFYTANGEFMIIYGDYSSTPKYRTWNGTEWSSQASLPSSGGFPNWIVARNEPTTNRGMLVLLDNSDATRSSYWDGSTWSAFVNHGTLSNFDSTDAIDLDWNLTSPTTLGLGYNTFFRTRPYITFWTGTSWGPAYNNRNVGGVPITIDLASRPDQNEILSCIKDSNADINCLHADYNSDWSSVTNGTITTNTDGGGQRSYAIEFERSGQNALIVYSGGAGDIEKRIPKYRVYDSDTNAFSSELVLPELGLTDANALKAVRMARSSLDDKILVLMADTTQNLYTILWDGDENNFILAGTLGLRKQAQNGSFDTDYWFDFEWDLN